MSLFFFFNDTATTEIYTLSLHDALPIWHPAGTGGHRRPRRGRTGDARVSAALRGDPDHGQGAENSRTGREERSACHHLDRKSTRLNSSHSQISYAVFCLKKKKKIHMNAH